VELSRYDLVFETRRAIKAQALTDFLAESSNTAVDSGSSPPSWNLYVDSPSTKVGSGVGLIIESPQGEWLEHTLKFMFKASNNEAEYEAMIAGVELYYTRGLTRSEHFRTLGS